MFITIEAQDSEKIGISNILQDVRKKLSFIIDTTSNLEEIDNYGREFNSISIIPTCVSQEMWDALGWRERKLISRSKKEADIRLRMDYERFCAETLDNKYLLFVDIIIKSILIIQSKSKFDFRGEELISDILMALSISTQQLESVRDTNENSY